MIELIQLEQLVAIAKNKTLTAASNEVALSQSALTRSIQRLEEALEVPLFNRTKNSMTLNENGEIALEYAQKILQQVENMKSDVQNNEKSRTVISLGTCAPAPVYFFEEELKKSGSHKRIEWTFEEVDVLPEKLKTRTYTHIIMPFSVEEYNQKNSGAINTTEPTKIVSEKLVDENLSFLLPNGHKFANRTEGIHLADMDGENFIVYHKIGFWDKIHRKGLPHSSFFFQEEVALSELIKKSTLPGFITDLSPRYFSKPTENRVIIPILDESAHAHFYLWHLE